VTSRKEKLTAKESTTGLTEKSTMANGQVGSKMATVCGEEYLVTHILVSGRTLKLMATVFISGKTVTDLKDPGATVSSMEKELIFLQMETFT
jgi:hypothetical protein